MLYCAMYSTSAQSLCFSMISTMALITHSCLASSSAHIVLCRTHNIRSTASSTKPGLYAFLASYNEEGAGFAFTPCPANSDMLYPHHFEISMESRVAMR